MNNRNDRNIYFWPGQLGQNVMDKEPKHIFKSIYLYREMCGTHNVYIL